MANYTQMATEIIEAVGGASNVTKVIHCITRLRFTLKDKDKADTAKVEAIPGVAGAVYNQGLNQYQVVIGQAVEDVYDEVVEQLGDSVVDQEATQAALAETGGGKGGSRNPFVHAFQVVIGTITGSMIPIIGLLAAGGMINGLLNIFIKGNGLLNWIDPNSPTKVIISTMAMAPFYFLPVLVGFSAAKQLAPKDNTLPYIGAAIGGFMIDPNLNPLTQATIATSAKGVMSVVPAPSAVAHLFGVTFNTSYFGIPVNLPSYAYSIFPVIVAVAIAKPLNAWLKKKLPLALRPIFQPMITFFVASSIVLLLVGPVISTISSALSNVIDFVLGLNLGIAGIIVGGFYQCLVIFGLHWLVVPLISQQLAATGTSSLNMIVSFTMLAQGTGALAVFFKTRKTDIKGLALPAAISAFCGVTEPAMYGINLKYSRVFIMSSIGAAVGAGVAGFMNLQMFGFSGSLIGFPNFISNPLTHAHPAGNLATFWIASIICMVVAFALVWMFGYKDSDVMGAGVEKKNAFKDAVAK
ncbi:PTS transporter subunit EIIC [Lactococcus fujiensis]|nr:PTS transporter subunit EIIC [Lactococcus fujiensis]